MILHARKCTFHPLPHQYWRGLRPFMQLHEKRHMKRAGEAGGSIALFMRRAYCDQYQKYAEYIIKYGIKYQTESRRDLRLEETIAPIHKKWI
ncbi:hypothetical protein FG183_02440 [Serratia marcescens subsp. marcescens ATCC 13880]|nr:hypothetical protein FG183_02440 [Serratia marcescens subsp. marcescens ATCC 13880]